VTDTAKGTAERITKKDIEKWVESIAYSILRVSHGTETGPTGLEMLAMSIAGEGLRTPVGHAVHDLSTSTDCLATAIRESVGDLPEAIEKLAESIDNHAEQVKGGLDCIAAAITVLGIPSSP
jgi:hypothetical protein